MKNRSKRKACKQVLALTASLLITAFASPSHALVITQTQNFNLRGLDGTVRYNYRGGTYLNYLGRSGTFSSNREYSFNSFDTSLGDLLSVSASISSRYTFRHRFSASGYVNYSTVSSSTYSPYINYNLGIYSSPRKYTYARGTAGYYRSCRAGSSGSCVRDQQVSGSLYRTFNFELPLDEFTSGIPIKMLLSQSANTGNLRCRLASNGYDTCSSGFLSNYSYWYGSLSLTYEYKKRPPPPPPPTTNVSEPTILPLLGIGALTLLGVVRRKPKL